jgi:hypothetical protein
MTYSGSTATSATAATAMPGGASSSAASAAEASKKAAAMTAPPKTTMPSGGGTCAPLMRTSSPGNVQAAMIASLACHAGIEPRASAIVLVLRGGAVRRSDAGCARGRG